MCPFMKNLMKNTRANLLRNSEIWQKIVFQRSFLKTMYAISPLLLMKYRYFMHKGSLPNLKAPKTFDEKLIWLNFFWRHPLKTLCGDKYTMRDYVQQHGLGHILTPLLAVYENPDEIDFERLPQRFVLKCTHGCGFNIICLNKKSLDMNAAKRKLAKWMKEDIGKISGEIHYATMKPRIICETFLEDLSPGLPTDYKVYCFYGKVHCTMACTGRDVNTRAKQYIFYDAEWKSKLPYNSQSMLAGTNIPKPAAYEEIIHSAEQLSKPFPFVRIDFYSIKGRAILGEMTFTPDGCIDPNLTEAAQRVMGNLILLPEKVC